MNNLILNLQVVCDKSCDVPNKSDFFYWLQEVLLLFLDCAEITIRLVNEWESQKLNMIYRGKNQPTNVLSFSFDMPLLETKPPLLGDLVICRQVVEREAKQQGKMLKSHWAHMVIHGSLHLLGFDHVRNKEAIEMESLETYIMQKLGYLDPYTITV